MRSGTQAMAGLLSLATCVWGCSDAGPVVAADTGSTAGGVVSSSGPTTSGADEGTSSGHASSSSSSGSESTGGAVPPTPEFVCPDPSNAACPSAQGPLRAGVAVRSIVPRCFEAWRDEDDDAVFDPGEDFLDCGCDRLCPEDDGYRAADEGEGDSVFQRTLIGGFGSPRPATGVRGAEVGLAGEGDGIDVRALVLEQGELRIALVVVDTVGVFRPDVTRIRAALAEASLEVDYVLVHAIHNHEGPDTMGLWGESLVETGYDPEYGEQWRAAALEAVTEAVERLAPVAEVSVGAVDASEGQPGGATNLIRDSRDPWVVDPVVSTLELRGEDGETIASVIDYACHPETLASRNTLLTADYVHALRRTVEQGSQWRRAPGREGRGGTAIFVSGALGGMMTTLGVSVTNPDGDTFTEASFDKADSIGQILGEAALDAMQAAEALPAPSLRLSAQSFELPVHNALYIFGFESGVIERDVVTEDQPPRVVTEMALLELGPLRMLSVPGELLPEIALGGYDGSALHAEEAVLIDPRNPNPPDLARAPAGPYLLERLASPEHDLRPWLIGLGNDELGYIIPAYDFELAESSPYLNQAEGDHYEETNALGPDTAGLIEGVADGLIDYANWTRRSTR